MRSVHQDRLDGSERGKKSYNDMCVSLCLLGMGLAHFPLKRTGKLLSRMIEVEERGNAQSDWSRQTSTDA